MPLRCCWPSGETSLRNPPFSFPQHVTPVETLRGRQRGHSFASDLGPNSIVARPRPDTLPTPRLRSLRAATSRKSSRMFLSFLKNAQILREVVKISFRRMVSKIRGQRGRRACNVPLHTAFPVFRAFPVKIHFFGISVMLKMGVVHVFHQVFFSFLKSL